MDRIEDAISRVWDFMRMGHEPMTSDLIWVLCSYDLRVANRAAELWHDGLAPVIAMSGGWGNFTRQIFEKPEAVLFKERAVSLGVPEEAVLVEDQSTNTGENIRFTRRLLKERGMEVSRVTAVQKPYMERRVYASIRKQWDEVEVSVTSPRLSLKEYCQELVTLEVLANIMVGDLQRIMCYPDMGFMIAQEIPKEVKEAWQLLVDEGFDGHLIDRG